MKKERFLDVNGFSREYDIPLEKRLNKYRKPRHRDRRYRSVPLTQKLAEESEGWRIQLRHGQVVTALIAAAAFAIIVAFAIYRAYFA